MLQQKPTQGFALLLALIITSVALAIGLSLLDVTVKQISLSATTRESEIAFQAAAAGMDCLVLARNRYSVDSQIDGSSFDVNCLDVLISFNDDNTDLTRQYYADTYDWTLPSGQNVCIGFEMTVIDATEGDETYVQPNGAGSLVCQSGRVCTFAYSRGYNHSCSEIQTGGSFLVQRELTAVF